MTTADDYIVYEDEQDKAKRLGYEALIGPDGQYLPDTARVAVSVGVLRKILDLLEELSGGETGKTRQNPAPKG